MKIAIGCDHGGWEAKLEIVRRLEKEGHVVIDCGTNGPGMVDYPVYAKKTVETMFSTSSDFAILICGTGIGMSVAANKIDGVRAAHCTDCFSAEMAKAHNDSNVLCLGARITGIELMWRIVKAYMSASFLGSFHKPRVEMLNRDFMMGKKKDE